MKFRLLAVDEIDCRISTCNKYGVGLLLYKDARCDQNILDETVGPMNWQRHHSRDNANCIVSIWDDDKKQWVEKEDTGTESFTEKEKGLASDSFKRACFNWGIGRELYTAPNMFVFAKDLKTLSEDNGRWTCKDSFVLTELEYEQSKISYVKIKNQKNNVEIEFGTPRMVNEKIEDIKKMKIAPVKVDVIKKRCADDGVPEERVLTLYKLNSFEDMTEEKFRNAFDNWEKIKEMK